MAGPVEGAGATRADEAGRTKRTGRTACSEDAIVGTLDDLEAPAFNAIIEPHIVQHVIELAAMFLDERDLFFRVLHALEEDQELVDIDTGKIYAVALLLVRNYDDLAIAQFRPQDRIEIEIRQVQVN